MRNAYPTANKISHSPLAGAGIGWGAAAGGATGAEAGETSSPGRAESAIALADPEIDRFDVKKSTL